MRLWDSGTFWSKINTSAGVYNWTLLDQWLNDAQSKGVQDLMYTFGKTPAWASSNPSDTSCAPWAPGECDPPNDLNADGSGTDQHWKDFVSAIASHAGGRIKYWEIWNEPRDANHWNGTIAQMVRMASDARTVILSIDPNAVLLTPPSRGPWQTAYFAAGGPQYADIITYHGYVQGHTCGIYPNASDVLQVIQRVSSVMQTYGQGNKPLWDTEAGWGVTSGTCFTNPDLQAAFLAQMYLLHWSAGVQRFYWYQYNNQTQGTLWKPTPNNPSGPGQLLEPGVAYGQIYNWLVGATMSNACAA
ncbi:MAG TPA: cellulase family glycosylhydrolase, partial [Terriglobales bacterium]|nr:cellulase family glycosylhydrolase [Terriglobales bacterium]